MTAPNMLRALLITMALSFASSICSAALAPAPPDAKAARDHFDKGIAAYEERRFGDAVEEFEAAYRISGAFKILFNIGQVSVALGRPVDAVDAYDKYLKLGGATVPAERRKEVQLEIEHQLARIGTLAVRTVPEGAEVRIDGALVGKTPLPRAARLPVGRHTVEAILAEHAPQLREVEIAGRAEVGVELTLKPLAAAPAPEVAKPAPTPPSPAVIPVMILPPPAPAPATEPTTVTARPSPVRAEGAGPPSDPVNWQRVIGSVVAVAGLGVATVGGVMAYKGINQTDEARERLGGAQTGEEYDLIKPEYDAAKHRAQVGWIVAGIGAAGVVGGILLVATAPERRSSLALAPWTGSQGTAGLAWSGRW